MKKTEPLKPRIEIEQDHSRMQTLEQQIRDIKADIEKAGNPGTENGDISKQVKLNDQRETLIKELDGLRSAYKVHDYSRAPDLATSQTANEFIK